jgi:hypothetical protein
MRPNEELNEGRDPRRHEKCDTMAMREKAETVLRGLADDYRRKAADMERLAELSMSASPEQEAALFDLALRARTNLHRH